MKVAIVTLLGNNYGGMLQTYALNHQLKEWNIDTIHIKHKIKSNDNIKEKLKSIAKRFIYVKRNKKFKEFKKLNLKFEKSLNENVLNCDFYIAGSDQIWNQKILLDDRRFFFLEFVKKGYKIAYAASIGRDEIDQNEKDQISEWLNSFKYISIREKTGVELYQKLTSKKIENVLDPTLLVDNNVWNEFCKNIDIPDYGKYIFSYTLGASEEVLSDIETISERIKTGIVEISYKKNFKNEIANVNDAGPYEFAKMIKNSEFVLTNSFHGMVFAIINKKDFFVFTRGNMNSRIYDLLKILELEDRIIDKEKNIDIENIDLNKKINYKKVYEILKKEQEKSLDFLKKALGVKK